MRWLGNVACMEEIRNVYKMLVGKPEEKRPLGRLKWISRKLCRRMWTGLLLLSIGPVVGFCEHGNEPSGSIKGGEHID
jgi:hypothetical protein